MSEKSQQEAIKVLTDLGVEIILDNLVKDYDGDRVYLSSGITLSAATLIWTSGVIARAVEGLPESAVGKGRRLLVNEYNQLLDYEDIFAIGDQCLQITDGKFPGVHPQLAQVAIQQGSHLAKNFSRVVNGEEMVPFAYRDKGSMAIIAKFRAVVNLPKGSFKGFLPG